MWIIRFFELMTGGTGAFLLVLALRNLRSGAASQSWPQTEGRVLRSFVLVQKDTDNGISFTPQVEYEYSVAGKTYRCMRIRYGQTGAWNRTKAEIVIDPYRVGKTIPVFFNPRKPANAVLVAGSAAGNLGIAAAGTLFAITAWLLESHVK